jgi:aspartyl protease
MVLLAAAIVRVHAGDMSSNVEIPFQFRDGLIRVRVTVPESREPLTFLLDSGAEASVLNLATAERLGLKKGNPVRVQGVGATAAGYWPVHLRASVPGLELPQVYVAVQLGELTDGCERQVDGLIGADFFCHHRVEINFAAQKIRLLSSGPISGDAIRIRKRAGALLVPLAVNHGAAQWVRLDTGCASPLQWVATKAMAAGEARGLAVGLAKSPGPMTRTVVQLGQTCFESVPTGLHQTRIFPGEAGLLGNGLLARFSSVIIDAQNKTLWLQPAHADPSPPLSFE